MTNLYSPTAETLRGLFYYKDGYLYNKVDRHKNPKDSKVDNAPNGEGYAHLQLKGKTYKVHRIIFAVVHGYFPEVVDHANGKTMDNRIENLRACSQRENFHNMKKVNNLGESGIQGVSRYYNKWRVRVGIFGKRVSFGLYDDIELAELVASEARDKYHKEFSVLRR